MPQLPTTNSRSPESRVQTAPGTHFASEHIQAQQGACCWMRLTRAVRANLHARPSPYDVIQPRGCLPRRRHRHHLRHHHPPPSTPLPTRPKEQRGSRSGSCGGGGGSSSSRAAAADAPVAAAAAASSRSSKVAATAAAQWQQRQEQRRRQPPRGLSSGGSRGSATAAAAAEVPSSGVEEHMERITVIQVQSSPVPVQSSQVPLDFNQISHKVSCRFQPLPALLPVHHCPKGRLRWAPRPRKTHVLSTRSRGVEARRLVNLSRLDYAFTLVSCEVLGHSLDGHSRVPRTTFTVALLRNLFLESCSGRGMTAQVARRRGP